MYALLLLSGVGYVWINYFLVRADFAATPNGHLAIFLPTLAFLFAAYFLTLKLFRPEKDYLPTLGISIVFRLALIAAIPNLSDDFFRFIWDGRLWNMGIDPLAHLPKELWESGSAEFQSAFSDIYAQLNSQGYYTVYPPVLQWVFRLATAIFPTGILGPVVVMKSLIVLAEIGSIMLLHHLVKAFGFERRAVLLYALNPLVIIELSGNLHFEAFMVFGLLAMIALLRKNNWWGAAFGMALAIGSKLIPILFFPFLFRRLGWQKWLGMGLITGLLCLGLFWSFLQPDALRHFAESVSLYYQKFEFNASFYFLLVGIFGTDFTLLFGKILPLIAILIILFSAWKEKQPDWKGLGAMLVLGYGTYEMLATTVHPWYQAPLIAFAALSVYRWPVVFSALISFTYIAYWNDYQLPTGFIWLEYLIVFSWIFYEWNFVRSGKTLEEWVLQRKFFRNWIKKSIPGRVKIKLERIKSQLSPNEKILDIGTGNGGLVLELRKAGLDIETVDVKDISFFEEVTPIVYDGSKLPFADASFDTVTIITVLHHTPDPDQILREALRVARKKIVIMEDVYRNLVQKHLTFFTDSLVNLEFAGHPHTNRTDAEWKATFEKMGLHLENEMHFRTLVFYSQVIYTVKVK